MLSGTIERSAGQGRGQYLALGLQSFQELLQGGSIKSPIERAWLSIAQFLVQPQSGKFEGDKVNCRWDLERMGKVLV
jgi:hypothetical protein